MALNTAGITAILEAGEAVTFWVAMGDGPTAGDQTSNERRQVTLNAVSGVLEATNEPLAYTGTPGAGATHGLFFNAAAAGTFYGFEEAAGDQAFNAAGEYNVTAFSVAGSST
jgi:hypothetical protein